MHITCWNPSTAGQLSPLVKPFRENDVHHCFIHSRSKWWKINEIEVKPCENKSPIPGSCPYFQLSAYALPVISNESDKIIVELFRKKTIYPQMLVLAVFIISFLCSVIENGFFNLKIQLFNQQHRCFPLGAKMRMGSLYAFGKFSIQSCFLFHVS